MPPQARRLVDDTVHLEGVETDLLRHAAKLTGVIRPPSRAGALRRAWHASPTTNFGSPCRGGQFAIRSAGALGRMGDGRAQAGHARIGPMPIAAIEAMLDTACPQPSIARVAGERRRALSGHRRNAGQAAAQGRASQPQEAQRFAANVFPIVEGTRASGILTLAGIARALNTHGIRSARGGKWHLSEVEGVLARCQS